MNTSQQKQMPIEKQLHYRVKTVIYLIFFSRQQIFYTIININKLGDEVQIDILDTAGVFSDLFDS